MSPQQPPAVLGVDGGSATVREAEHLLHEIVGSLPGLPADLLACTHLIRDELPHVAISLTVPAGVELSGLPDGLGLALGGLRAGPRRLATAAALAAAEHTARRSGRAVLFPGVERLTGVHRVADLLAETGVERIVVLCGDGEPGSEVLVDTRGFVRPEWRDGRLTLVAMPAGDGRLAPFEVANPTPCCADHA